MTTVFSKKNNFQRSETILLVEDNADLRYYIRTNLPSNFRIIEADNGEKGIELALDEIPDLIITDIMMPKADGIELCRKLKTDEKTSHIPIIILTSKSKTDSRLEGLSTGADDYIQKPFDINELLARVMNLIENRKKLREKFSSQILLKPKDILVQSGDDKFLNKVLASAEDHISDVQFSVDGFAREVGMSTAQLYRKLNAVTGYTPNDFMRHMRLQRAADLMDRKAGNVAEVAYQVGFNNLSYFAKCFRDKFGKSPSEYLKSAP
jgi:DNA-binding response OmpR family regulator